MHTYMHMLVHARICTHIEHVPVPTQVHLYSCASPLAAAAAVLMVWWWWWWWQMEKAAALPCGHLFHQECVREWISRQKDCPTCREKLVIDDTVRADGHRPGFGEAAAMPQCHASMPSCMPCLMLAWYSHVDVYVCAGFKSTRVVESIR